MKCLAYKHELIRMRILTIGQHGQKINGKQQFKIFEKHQELFRDLRDDLGGSLVDSKRPEHGAGRKTLAKTPQKAAVSGKSAFDVRGSVQSVSPIFPGVGIVIAFGFG